MMSVSSTVYTKKENLNPKILKSYLDVLEKEAEIHSISIIYNGEHVLEGSWTPFTLTDPQMMHSVSKIGVTLSLGFALDAGKLHLEDKILDYLRDELPTQYDSALENVTIYDLLTMQAGSLSCCNNVWFSQFEKEWETQWLSQPKLAQDVGKKWHYDSGCSYTLSNIITKVMEKPCIEIIQERVFDKIGIPNISWLKSPEGVNTGGWGMYLTAGELSLIAQLLLQEGEWKGKQILPKWYIEKMCTAKVPLYDNPPESEEALMYYGFHLYTGKDVVAAEGAFGQYIMAFKNYPVAIGITAGSYALNIPDLTVKYILDAIKNPCPKEEFVDAEASLCERLKSLSLPSPSGDKAECPEALKTLLDKKISFGENPRNVQSVIITQPKGNELNLVLEIEGKGKKAKAGFLNWIRNDLYPGDFTKKTHSISYAFTEDKLNISVGLINTSYREEYTLSLKTDGKIAGQWHPNVTYLPKVPNMIWEFNGVLEP